jgi:hypothetical protein
VLKRKRETAGWAGGVSKLGRCGLLAHAGKRPLAWEPSRAKKMKGERLGRLGRKKRGEGERAFFFFEKKFFSNSFSKLSNFNQTEIHAFES